MDEAHRHGLDPFLLNLLHNRLEVLLPERFQDPARIVDPFPNCEHIPPGNEMFRFAVLEGVQLLTVPPRNGIGVSQTGGHDQKGSRAFSFQKRVQAHCGSVDEEVDLRQMGNQSFQTLQDPLSGISAGGGNFPRGNSAARGICDNEVRKGTSDIHRGPISPLSEEKVKSTPSSGRGQL